MGGARRKIFNVHRGHYVVLLLVVLFIISLMVVINIDTVGAVKYRQSTFSQGALFLYRSNVDHRRGWSQYEFKNAEYAVTTYFEIGITTSDFQEIIRFDEGVYSLIFVPGFVETHWFRPNTPTVFSFMFEKKENGMLTPVYRWTHGIEALWHDTRGMWDDEDRVARDILMSYIQAETTAVINNGIPLYYGIGMGAPPGYIYILGETPDRVIPFEFDGEQYFFWYFSSPTQFGEVLTKSIDIFSAFTLADIITLLDIKVGR